MSVHPLQPFRQRVQAAYDTTQGDLLVGNCRTGRTGEADEFKTLETDLAAPPTEIRPCVVRRVTEFDKHIERHQ
jgi:hypothetical protein